MIDWFARNTVAANLLMMFILIGGLIAATNLTSETMPEISLDRILVDVPYLGAAPEEVEEAVCVRIEEAIYGTDGIKQIISTASEGMGSVMIELELGADVRRVLDDVKGRVDAIDTFPEETEKPIIRELVARQPVTDVAVSGHADEFVLKAIAERVRDELASLPEISQVEVTSARPYEISIEVSETALRRHGFTFDDVADAVRRSSLDLPGRLGAQRVRRSSAPHHRAGVSRRRIRGPDVAGAGGRHPAHAWRRRHGRGRLCRNRPVCPLRPRTHRADLRLQHRRAERPRDRRPRRGVRGANPSDATRGDLAHALARTSAGIRLAGDSSTNTG